MSDSRPSLEQAVLNYVKIARTLIRLRHAVAADDELNAVIPDIRERLEQQANTGKVTGLTLAEIGALLEPTPHCDGEYKCCGDCGCYA